jgi:hypothetical protein
MSIYFFIAAVFLQSNEDAKRRGEGPSECMPYGSCRRHENVENRKAGFPHFHSALENSPPEKRGREFPTASTGPTAGIVSVLAFKSENIELPR